MGTSHPPPNEAFRALAKRYANQRSRGVFPHGLFRQAEALNWVSADTPASQLHPPSHPQLTDAELSALAGKPVYDIRIDPTPHSPRHINLPLSKTGARLHWKIVRSELKRRMSPELYDQIENPRQMREKKGQILSAYSYQLNFMQTVDLPRPAPLPDTHPLHGLRVELNWPRKHRLRQPSDISVIRMYPTNYSPGQMWEHFNCLSSPRLKGLRIPKNNDLDLMIQAHEWGHTVQPYPNICPHNEAYYGEEHSDRALAAISTRLGVKPGVVEAFMAARAIGGFAYTNAFGPSAWSCHTTSPAFFWGGFKAWPLGKLNAVRRQVRAHTDLMLVGEDCTLSWPEIEALTTKDTAFFKAYDDRAKEVRRQLGRARLAEEQVDGKPDIKAERRLLAMKKIWMDTSMKLDREMLVMIGHTLEGAALFWPELKQPNTRLTPALCRTFRSPPTAKAG